VLGAFGWQSLLSTLASLGYPIPAPRPPFAHATHLTLASPTLHLFGCYHVSQQNTFTGKLTPAMLEAVLVKAKEAAGI